MSVEEDSEPILGLWFEETLSPSEGSPSNITKETTNELGPERTTATIVPDNREPHGVSVFLLELLYELIIRLLINLFLFSQYISLATQIFQFMNQHLIGSRSSYVREYVVNGLIEQQMVILAAIIRDLDHETARTETGIIVIIIVIFIFKKIP